MTQLWQAAEIKDLITRSSITTMLDDPTWCAQSVVVDLRHLCLGYVGIGMSSFGSLPMYSYWLPIDTDGLSLVVWLQFQRGTFWPPVRNFFRRVTILLSLIFITRAVSLKSESEVLDNAHTCLYKNLPSRFREIANRNMRQTPTIKR